VNPGGARIRLPLSATAPARFEPFLFVMTTPGDRQIAILLRWPGPQERPRRLIEKLASGEKGDALRSPRRHQVSDSALRKAIRNVRTSPR